MSRVVSKPLPQAQLARKEYAKIPKLSQKHDPAEYTKQPHAYGDVLVSGGKLGGAIERDVLYWIERNTWGRNVSRKEGVIERPEWAKLSITQLARLCQVWDEEKGRLRPVERKTIAVALARMERDGIIAARDRKGCGATVAKMYKLTPEKWKKAPAYKPPTPKQLAEVEAALEDEEEDDDTPTMPELAAGAAVPVDPGKYSRPQSMAVSPAGKDQPTVTIRVVYNPQGFTEAITFRCRPGRNGRLVVTAQPGNYGCAQPQGFATSSPSKTNVTDDSERVNSYKQWIPGFVRQVFGKAADKELIESIISNTGQAPIETFQAIVTAKFAGRGKRHTTGLLIELAKDAATTHRQDHAAAWRQFAERARQSGQGFTGETTPTPDMAARLEELRTFCAPCNGTGNAGAWDHGKFIPTKGTCGKCAGKGRKEGAACN